MGSLYPRGDSQVMSVNFAASPGGIWTVGDFITCLNQSWAQSSQVMRVGGVSDSRSCLPGTDD